ncbi:PhoX family protein [Muricauda oceani]|uniref:Phosphatase n=1 Tax=Flagellimonas oceani TaxID=2698672 RepID=A0A6G7IX74_9FLAO|nr:phosphatase [Allomuricauda oceani]MBW8241553.1 PhoX family protein [Allomuricauda oceani]QII43145.1 phosphatase [Allomuricauda oceani]
MKFTRLFLSMAIVSIVSFGLTSCEGEDGRDGIDGVDGADGQDGADGIDGEDGEDLTSEELTPLTSSVVPNNVFELKGAFAGTAQLEMIMTSADILPSDSTFVFGAYTDGAALFPYEDGTFALINNLERDFSIARIRVNSDLQPLEGDYIVNATATAFTAQCSGSAITVEEHGFGPLYLSGGEWGGNAKGVYKINPFRSAEDRVEAERLPALGEWSTENAVAISKNAYPNQTVVFMGDDDSQNEYPSAHFGMYVGARGDLYGGKLYVLRGKDTTETAIGGGGLKFEMGMAQDIEYDVEWVEVTERTLEELNQEAIDSVAIGFQRIEDIDWQRGSAENNRNVFFNATGRINNPDLANRGTSFGRVYKLELNPNDPIGDAKLTVVVDGDLEGGKGDGMHSPDNIVVTERYAYIQEDPNGYADRNPEIQGYAKLWQYDIMTGDFTEVMECNQIAASELGIGNTDTYWEITGMIDVTDILGTSEPTFIAGAQVHGWTYDSNNPATFRADGAKFVDPTAIDEAATELEGSFLFKITGLPR